jgi:rubrerythrin
MTTTAQGTALRCDTRGCTQPATVEAGAWGYCARHAGHTAPTTAATPKVDISHAHTPLPASKPQPAPIARLLEDASGHSSKRVRTLAGRIENDLEKLRTLVAELAADEARKQAEAAAKKAAQEEIARLEQQLAAAKAKLRAPGTAKRTPPPRGDGTCRDCGTTIVRQPGQRGVLPTRCPACKQARA